MPTVKSRINISVSDDMERAIAKLAKRDRMPKATKAMLLLADALEIEEDSMWDEIAKKRDRKGTRLIPHKSVWA